MNVDRINAETRLGGLLASPAAQSASPAIYNAAFAVLGLNCCYLAFDVKEEDFSAAMQAVRALNMFGVNISMPYKTLTVGHMDSLSPAAELIGAVNTVRQRDGYLEGHNTDGAGFVANLRAQGVDIRGMSMLQVGAGGAGAAVATQCALDGIGSLTLFNKRDAFFPAAERLAARITQKTGVAVTLLDLDDRQALEAAVGASDLVVNTTNVGMGKLAHLSVVEEAAWFREGTVVADTVYHPAKTKLLTLAETRGCRIMLGEGMLIHQAAECFRIFTGLPLPAISEEIYMKKP